VGKTRLALSLAQDLTSAFRDGVHWVDLAPERDPDRVLPLIAEALGLYDMGGTPVRERLIDALRQRQTLIVLDNVEHLLPAAPDLADLLRHCPTLTLLATSRVPLRLSLERLLPLAPLALPDADRVSLEAIVQAPAINLFVTRAQAVAPSFSLTPANAETVRAICTRLDGLPLAIELAAARLAHAPLETLRQRLERSLSLLRHGPRDAPERQQSMRAAIAWSYDLLAPDEQRVLRSLSIFSGGISLEAAEAVSDLAPDALFDALSALVDAHVLVRMGPDDVLCYRVPEPIREFGLDQLSAAGEPSATQQAHADYYLTLAERVAPEWWGASPGLWLDRLEAGLDNIRAALTYAMETGSWELACRLTAAMHWYWRIRGPVSEGLHWYTTVLAGATDVPAVLRGAVLVRAGDIAMLQGAMDKAAPWVTMSRRLAEVTQDGHLLTWSLGMGGLLALYHGELDRAHSELRQTVGLARTHDVPSWVAAGLGQLATIARRRGDLDQEQALLEQALACCDATGMTWYAAGLRNQLGDIAVDRERFSLAEEHYRAALATFQAIGERRNMAGVLAGFAWIAAAQQDESRAAQLCGAVDALLVATDVRLSPHGQVRYERARAAAQSRLSNDAFSSAVKEGQQTRLADILAGVTEGDRHREERRASGRATHTLTARELTVLRLLAGRRTDREIASDLFLSPRTVQSHVANILAKLDVPDRREAEAEAARRGLL